MRKICPAEKENGIADTIINNFTRKFLKKHKDMNFLNNYYVKPKKNKKNMNRLIFKIMLINLLIMPFLKAEVIGRENDINVQPTQQGVVVTGVVTDETGETLPGVNVSVKGTTTGITTGVNGDYSLSVPSREAVLVFSYVGYVTVERIVGQQTVINIQLDVATALIDEVVVIGYGTMRKKDLTGAVSSVKKTAIENEKPRRVNDMLRANIPGLSVGFDVSAKGGGDLQIRGKNTLKAGSSPLIILDGIIFNGDLSNINPNDIETIDVLKDASSAAVYGARSANGVVLITTKLGSETDKPIINFNASYGLETISAMAKVYSPDGWLKWRQDVMKSMNMTNVSLKDKLYIYDDPNNLPAGVTLDMWRDGNQNDPLEIYLGRMGLGAIEQANYRAGNPVDWADYVYQNGYRQDYNISIQGKANTVKYYWSLGYEDNKGNVIGDKFNTIRSLLRLESNLNKWLTVGLSANFAIRNQGFPSSNTDQYRTNSPYGSRYMDDGVTLRYSSTNDPVSSVVPDYDMQFIDRRDNYKTLTTNLYARIKLPFNISYELDFAPRFEYRNYMNHQSAFHQEWGRSGGLAQRENQTTQGWELNNLIRWNQSFLDLHRFEVTLLASAEQRQYWSNRMETQDFNPSDVLGYHMMQSGSSHAIRSTDEYSTADALMARLFYSFKDRYQLTLTIRRDGYSAFGGSNPHGVFPSAAVGWIFTEEDFLKNDFLPFGKLRFSWGENGNRDIGIYDALANLSSAKYSYQELNGTAYEVSRMYVSRMANSKMKWEKKRSFNIGFDFGLKGDILSGSIEWYNASTLDLLVDRKMPNVSGFTEAVANLGQVDNRGLELSLNAKLIDNKNFKWNGSLIFNTNKNKIVSLYGDMEDVLDSNGNVIGQREKDDTNNKWFIGQPIDEIWNYKVLGVWQLGEEEQAARYNQFPGDFHIKDANNDGIYNDLDKEFLGRTVPIFTWSMRHQFNFFRDFDFSFLLYSSWGHKTDYNAAKNSDGFVERQNAFVNPYWTPENPINDYSRIRSQTGGIAFDVYRDRSFIRLDNISLGYNVPRKIIGKVDISNIKVTASIRNVGVWAPYWPDNWWDPETKNRGMRNYNVGISVTL